MSLYVEEIKKLLDKQITAVPYVLLTDYLQRNYGLSQYASEEAVYSAARERAVIEKDGYIVRPQRPIVDSQALLRAKAFAVVLEYMPEAQHFCAGTTPWVYAFIKDGIIYQVGYIARGDEFAQSNIVCMQPVPVEERAGYRRILVVEKGVNLDKIKAAGYRNICTVDETDNFNIEIIKKIPQNEAWADVRA